ncbi:ABC transporter ATP-binding protein [Wenyingzhuangia marina]|uniref:Nitrate/nitrite transport system ATP-binding protein n=1 Tax=Wenyingzhuangia marina TaxID=1195760 RepID=A0A1M5WFY3_9FLAO|nr:ABC transporter ATP-binding protein [Wenyingzhuangia marina]GGF81163.1 nitrate ABC transporter ATP-binding protein [Wenyingzhuangia marina]SHH86360.1 nitrate/nitrite transport system ATP-binding protein [Wenyingzhuangia marina]
MNQLIHNPEIEKFPSNEVMLDLIDLKKVYPTPKGDYVVLENLNLQIKKEEFITIIGHSGCGKTTMLSMMAGLNEISGGKISVLGSSIKGPGPDRGVIFQAPSLMPWLTTMENVMLGVKKVYPHATKKQKEDICKYYLHKVGMESSFNKRASEISQGEQQRVGIARAFAIKPKVLLLDEPFGMLDSLTRGQLQDVLIDVWNKEKITAVMITHDVDEAIFLADRVVMMTSGPKAKIGDVLPIEFERPRTRKAILEHDDYYKYRKHLIDFLEH